MEKLVEQALLFDFYGELLTEHQRQVYEDVVLNDYSLSEVATDLGISRQGVHDMVKRSTRILQDYEEKLRLVQKFETVKEKVHQIHLLTQQPQEAVDGKTMEMIASISHEILEEL